MPKTKEEKTSHYYVSHSNIHGKGLFAKKKISKGSLIGKIKGKKTEELGPHVLWIDEKDHGVEVRCDLRYINHSNNPNSAYFDDLTVVAITDIKAGEELTHHYGDEWEEQVKSENALDR
jgi:SET domain-containing protein